MTTHHPDAALFPMLSEVELFQLGDDISANGLRETIKLDHTGEFLVDGRNREKACVIADVKPRYERLPAGIDIFAYVVSVNLRRRHLTDEQRQAIIREIKRRNPELSNRQVAKLANVSPATVDRVVSCSTAAGEAVEHKTTGADGKLRPASGRIDDVTRANIIAEIKDGILSHRDIVAKYGVSVGTVSGIRSRLKEAGELPTARRPTIAEQLAKRAANLPRFDTMTREERGMGSREYGAEQHPDYPPGWTRDVVHREKYGRIQIYTPAQIAEQELVKRFHAVIVALKAIAENAPDADDLDSISYQEIEAIDVQLEKFGPRALDLITGYMARRRKPKLTVVKP